MSEAASSPQPAAARTHSFPLLDALRALATLTVFVNHVSYRIGDLHSGFAAYITQRNNAIVAPAIAVFFVLSGFLLYRPFALARLEGRSMPNVRAYLTRRALRIVPAYWVALPLVAVLISAHEVFHPRTAYIYFGFLQVYDQSTLNNGVAQAWTLDVDVPFYLVLPLAALLLRFWRPRGKRDFLLTEIGVLGLVLAASLAWQSAVFQHATANKFFPGLLSLPGSADLLALGMILATLSAAMGDSWPRRPFALIERAPWVPVIAAGALFWAMPHISGALKDHRVMDWWVTHLLKGLFAILLMLPAIIGRERRDVLRRAMGSRFVAYMSDRSYAFYLWHLAAIDVVADLGFRGHVGAVGLVMVAFAATVMAAELSWRIVERPAQRLGRRITRARTARPELAAAETAPR